MSAQVIFDGAIGGCQWCIERQPEGVTDPAVVSFRKWNRKRSLLNRSARVVIINGRADFDTSRWFPKTPTVPDWLIRGALDLTYEYASIRAES